MVEGKDDQTGPDDEGNHVITKKYADFLKKIESQREERAAQYSDLVANLRDIAGRPVTDTAAKIMLSGMKRRNELPEKPQFPDDVRGRRAKAIVNAGRKARGEEPI
jgi:hypothetical protein